MKRYPFVARMAWLMLVILLTFAACGQEQSFSFDVQSGTSEVQSSQTVSDNASEVVDSIPESEVSSTSDEGANKMWIAYFTSCNSRQV